MKQQEENIQKVFSLLVQKRVSFFSDIDKTKDVDDNLAVLQFLCKKEN